MKKKVLIGSIVLIVLIIIYYVIYLHFRSEAEEKEKLRENLMKFYEEYVYEGKGSVPAGNISCEGNVIIDKSRITGKYSCISFPLYSSIGEAWYIVARGNYSWETGHINTVVGEGVPESERIKKIYSLSIEEGNPGCDIPCYDSLPPKAYTIDVSYSPTESKLREMFLKLNYSEINSLILRSNYLVQLDYETQSKPEHSLDFGLRMGWQIPHKFSLNLKVVNGEILDYSIKVGEYYNRSVDCKGCKITRIGADEIRIEGVRSFEEYPLLSVRWKWL